MEYTSLTRDFGKKAALLAGLQRTLDCWHCYGQSPVTPGRVGASNVSPLAEWVNVAEACKSSRGREGFLKNFRLMGFTAFLQCWPTMVQANTRI